MDAAALNQAIQDLTRAKTTLDNALKAKSDTDAQFAIVSQGKSTKDTAAADAINAYNAALDALGTLIPEMKAVIPQAKV